MAQATGSSLKAHRSSREPPPRPVMMRSMSSRLFTWWMAAAISSAAPSPCTRTGTTNTSVRGQRWRKMRIISRTAAPAGEVTRAIRLG